MTGLELETGNESIMTRIELREEFLNSTSLVTGWREEETPDVFLGSAYDDDSFDEEEDDFEDDFDDDIDDKEILDDDFDFDGEEDDLFDDEEDPQYN